MGCPTDVKQSPGAITDARRGAPAEDPSGPWKVIEEPHVSLACATVEETIKESYIAFHFTESVARINL